MVQVIQQETQPLAISVSYVWWKVGLTGVVVGVLWWLLSYIGLHLIIDPFLCKSSVDVSACSDPIGLASNIATILAGSIGLGVIIRQRIFRPIIVALASAVTLWGLGAWVDGLSIREIIAWSALLYGLAYLLYSWISRYALSVPVMLAVACVIIITRIAVVL